MGNLSVAIVLDAIGKSTLISPLVPSSTIPPAPVNPNPISTTSPSSIFFNVLFPAMGLWELALGGRSYAGESKTCPFYSGTYSCWGEEVKRYDLKKLYTRCDYPSGGLDFTADLVFLDDEGKKPPLYILIRTDYLAPLTLPPDVLLVEIAVRTEDEAMDLRNKEIIEGGDRVHCLFYGPWKRKGGLSYRPLCERKK